MENLLRQGGLGDPTELDFESNGDVDISDFVLLVHGDLLTKERLDTVRDSRSLINNTPKNRFQFVVFVLGLFHYKMACVDALWRTYLQVKEGREDVNSTYQHVGILRPRETGLMMTKPGFRQMHNVVHHELRAVILECWRKESSRLVSADSESASLKAFAETKPNWELIVKISEDIVRKYVATTGGLRQSRAKPESERDQQFENQALQNRDYLLYVDLCNAINVGDVGRVEASFLHWIYVFRATGKHKYASQLARYLKNLHEVYPPELSQIVRMNMLCNPTGKPNAFRPVDWLVERNNLYMKVIYARSGPNRTMDYICQQSPLIEVFRSCHVIHTPPDMTVTIERLREHLQSTGCCEFQKGRVVEREVMDSIIKGLQTVHAKKPVQPEETHEVEASDLEAH
ncbi:hypothetical protein EDB92DRAFT_1938755 [Lactarius akahatsu]|uniref:DUF6589 domain-containing protein n=1 Tax=Lactarius akahatsu TaxID=416441 RepID=A0AAD4L223_9AGAM|nr:hypothetical protein EDB92DRAFT_1938755 [Lactarius akahatsu]